MGSKRLLGLKSRQGFSITSIVVSLDYWWTTACISGQLAVIWIWAASNASAVDVRLWRKRGRDGSWWSVQGDADDSPAPHSQQKRRLTHYLNVACITTTNTSSRITLTSVSSVTVVLSSTVWKRGEWSQPQLDHKERLGQVSTHQMKPDETKNRDWCNLLWSGTKKTERVRFVKQSVQHRRGSPSSLTHQSVGRIW